MERNTDIAATDSVNGVVQIFTGIGDGTFGVGQCYATDTAGTPNPTNLVSGDFNKDGRLDLAIANSESDTLSSKNSRNIHMTNPKNGQSIPRLLETAFQMMDIRKYPGLFLVLPAV